MVRKANPHGHLNMPFLLAGQGGGQIATGRHAALPSGTPVANAYLEVLRICGAEQPTFGDDGVLPLDLS